MTFEPVRYRVVDFELATRRNAAPLIEELAEHIIDNRVCSGTRRIVIHVRKRRKSDLESEINTFCDLIEGLSPKACACWKACSSRLIDIGIDSGNMLEGKGMAPLKLQISSSTLKRISEIEGKLVITVYPYIVQKDNTFS